MNDVNVKLDIEQLTSLKTITKSTSLCLPSVETWTIFINFVYLNVADVHDGMSGNYRFLHFEFSISGKRICIETKLHGFKVQFCDRSLCCLT